MIASHLVNPYDITVSWNNIAGLNQVIDEIKETVIFPVQRKELLRNSVLTKPPKGIPRLNCPYYSIINILYF